MGWRTPRQLSAWLDLATGRANDATNFVTSHGEPSSRLPSIRVTDVKSPARTDKGRRTFCKILFILSIHFHATRIVLILEKEKKENTNQIAGCFLETMRNGYPVKK